MKAFRYLYVHTLSPHPSSFVSIVHFVSISLQSHVQSHPTTFRVEQMPRPPLALCPAWKPPLGPLTHRLLSSKEVNH